jgi:hypothetical protein
VQPAFWRILEEKMAPFLMEIDTGADSGRAPPVTVPMPRPRRAGTAPLPTPASRCPARRCRRRGFVLHKPQAAENAQQSANAALTLLPRVALPICNLLIGITARIATISCLPPCLAEMP